MSSGEKPMKQVFGQMPLFLAPMAGFTDCAYREICKEFGCDITESEMVSAKGFHYGSEKTRELTFISDMEKTAVIQLFGHEADIMAEAAETIQASLGNKLLALDINMGCPAPKITGNGDGSSLMRNPVLVERIVNTVRNRVSVPIAVKIRKGICEGQDNAVEVAMAAEAGGASWVTVHGRTADQMYSGKADLGCVASVKQHISVPVVGNGDITDAESAIRMIRETGCDGLMIGRGALGNPWVFEEIRAAIRGEVRRKPNLEDKIRIAIRHVERTVEFKGEHGVIELRKHIFYYFRGLPGATEIRRKLQKASTLQELRHLLLDTVSLHEYNI